MKRTRQQYREAKKERLRKTAAKKAIDALRARSNPGEVKVNIALLKLDYSYHHTDFAKRGYYLDQPFQCQDCGVQEVWTAHQQKWWYEIAKGGVWTVSSRCRSCRRREREHQITARKIHLEGVAKKGRKPSPV
jgi:hypothetical protein